MPEATLGQPAQRSSLNASSSRSLSSDSGDERIAVAPEEAAGAKKACVCPRMTLHQFLLGSFILICLCLILFYSVAAFNYDWADSSTIAYVSSFGFTLLTIMISFRLITQHLGNWTLGHLQKHIVRIIFLLPIYAVESWMALYIRAASLYIETIRETYEAYVIWNFFSYVVALVGDEHRMLEILNSREKSGRGTHPFPCRLCLTPWSAQQLLRSCRLGIVQYVIIKNITAIAACILESYGAYDEGSFAFTSGYLYLSAANNYSQTWALYCLVKFYVALKEEMHSQVGKFVAVKCVVFVTWWQGLALNILTNHTNFLQMMMKWSQKDALNEGSRFNHQQFHSAELYNWWTEDEIAAGLQNFLICVEMFIASVAFTYIFGYAEFVKDAASLSREGSATSFGVDDGSAARRNGGIALNTLAAGSGTRSRGSLEGAEEDIEGYRVYDSGDDEHAESQSLLMGPHSSLSSGTTTAKRTGGGRVREAAAALMQSSVPVDLISDFKDASRDLVYSFSAKKKSPLRDFGREEGQDEDDGEDEEDEELELHSPRI